MDLHHEHPHQSLLHRLESELYHFYLRENHTIADYLVLNVIISAVILVLLFAFEFIAKF